MFFLQLVKIKKVFEGGEKSAIYRIRLNLIIYIIYIYDVKHATFLLNLVVHSSGRINKKLQFAVRRKSLLYFPEMFP